MEKQKKVIIMLVIYILSCTMTWSYFKIVYSKDGMYPHGTPGLFEIAVTFCPAINTAFGIIAWLNGPYAVNKSGYDCSKFFNVKK